MQIVEKSAQKDGVESDEEHYDKVATANVAEERIRDTEVSNEWLYVMCDKCSYYSHC